MTKLITVTSALILLASAAKAAHIWEDPSGWWDAHFTYDQNAPKYTAQELSLDLFASYINPERNFPDLFDTSIREGFWGGGVGLNYFLTRSFGLGADFNISSKTGDLDLVDQVTGSAILRLPLGNSGIAPYIIGSGGRSISPRYSWIYGGGVGIEARFNPTTGIFSDARFFWSERATEDNRLLIRAGVRLVF
ncbi:MAG TPA: hypothetical protein VEC99_18855 [Clostridia bacterium]|nr:hypothetical protein [Clostridia bacterium]